MRNTIEVCLFSFNRKKVIARLRKREKMIGPGTCLKENNDLFLLRAKPYRKAAIFLVCMR